MATARASTILVVDDDADIRQLVDETLSADGFTVLTAASTRDMERVLARETVDLVVLDVMMPGEDGIAACVRLRQRHGPPVIFLSARGAETDRVLGLETGASHYLAKPCSPRELLATVRAALRLQRVDSGTAGDTLAFEGWSMNVNAWELLDPRGVLVHLTEGEFTILRSLAERPRRVLSRERLLELRGGEADAFDRAIDIQISRLRRKLSAPGDEMIRTVRNEGYLFVPAVTRR